MAVEAIERRSSPAAARWPCNNDPDEFVEAGAGGVTTIGICYVVLGVAVIAALVWILTWASRGVRATKAIA